MFNRALCVAVWVVGVGAHVLSESARAQNEMLFAAEQVDWGSIGTPIAIDDVDLDGRLDIVTHGMSCDTETWECVFGVYVRLGRPDRSFSEPQFHQAGTTANQWPNPILDLFIRDVNADGWPDIVYLDSSRREVIVLPALGSGAFGAAVISSCAGPNQAVSALDLGDVDGDGVVDAAVSLYTGPQGCKCVRILRGSGTGSFSLLTTVTMGPWLYSLRMRDLNGDGPLDLIALVDDGDVVTRLGLGAAQFAEPVTTILPFPLAEISLVDLDVDELPDIVAPSYTQADLEDESTAMVSLLRNVGGGAFSPVEDISLTQYWAYGLVALSHAVADVNADGAVDILVAAPQVEAGSRSMGVPDDAVYLLPGRGGFVFAEPVELTFAGAPSALYPADLDTDGVSDLVYGTSIFGFQPTVGVRYGRLEGGFESEGEVRVGSPTVDLASGDANLDRHVDIALAHKGAVPAVSLQLGAGDGTFSAGQPISFPGPVHRVLLSDVSADGWPDLVTASSIAGATIHVHLGFGNGTFDAPVAVSMEPAADLETTDLNQDGLVDLLSCDPGSQRVFVQLGLGGGAFAAPIGYPAGGASQRLSVGDLDEDGDADVLVANPDPASTSVLQMTLAMLQNLGGAQLGLPTLYEVIGAQDVAVADLDRDGHLDAVLAIYADGILEGPFIWTYAGTNVCAGLGDGTLGEPVYVSQPVVPWRVETADLNRDGWLDVVASPAPLEMVGDNATLGPLRCIGVGLGKSDDWPRREIAVEGRAQPVATTVADFDEDGFPDIAAADSDSDSISVMLNRSRTWATLGWDLAPIGGGGVPLLAAKGRPVPDEAISLESTSSMLGRGSPGVLVVGVDTAYTPFHGGFLVPSIGVSAPIQCDVPLIGRWPKGIPAGTPVYLQALFTHGGGEVVASNALVVIAQ